MFYNFELMVQKYKVRFSLWGNHQNFKQANNESTEIKRVILSSNSYISNGLVTFGDFHKISIIMI